jgi:hypothetical protein
VTQGSQDWALPEPGHRSDVTLSAVLAGRRSAREFADVGLDRSDMDELLWAAQGVTGGDGLKAAAVFAISADVSRTARRYGGRTERCVFLEAGHQRRAVCVKRSVCASSVVCPCIAVNQAVPDSV